MPRLKKRKRGYENERNRQNKPNCRLSRENFPRIEREVFQRRIRGTHHHDTEYAQGIRTCYHRQGMAPSLTSRLRYDSVTCVPGSSFFISFTARQLYGYGWVVTSTRLLYRIIFFIFSVHLYYTFIQQGITRKIYRFFLYFISCQNKSTLTNPVKVLKSLKSIVTEV